MTSTVSSILRYDDGGGRRRDTVKEERIAVGHDENDGGSIGDGGRVELLQNSMPPKHLQIQHLRHPSRRADQPLPFWRSRRGVKHAWAGSSPMSRRKERSCSTREILYDDLRTKMANGAALSFFRSERDFC